jgi:hypothetical protein
VTLNLAYTDGMRQDECRLSDDVLTLAVDEIDRMPHFFNHGHRVRAALLNR